MKINISKIILKIKKVKIILILLKIDYNKREKIYKSNNRKQSQKLKYKIPKIFYRIN